MFRIVNRSRKRHHLWPFVESCLLASSVIDFLESEKNPSAHPDLGHLFLVIGRFGRPRAIRSDNDAALRSRVFRSVCVMFGIHQQFTHPGCPWLNGRVERLFGSLKRKLDQLEVDSCNTLVQLMDEFLCWYNHVGPHQNLKGLKPAEAWEGIDPYAIASKQAIWLEGWRGMLNRVLPAQVTGDGSARKHKNHRPRSTGLGRGARCA